MTPTSGAFGAVGGWLGDVLEGIKPATVDALGFGIRDAAGIDQNPVYTVSPDGTATPQVITNPDAISNDDMLLYMGLIIGAFVLLDD